MRRIVISGADGTGKTTLIDGLAKRLRAEGRSVACVSLWDLYQAPELPRIFTSRGEAQQYLRSVSSRSRVHFFLHCLYGALDRAEAAGPVDVLLIDAYWYKYLAGERALGHSFALEGLVADFPVPDVILELDAPPEQTAARKQTFGLYECGLVSADRGSFVAFQRKLRPLLSAVVREQPTRLVELDATRGPAVSLENALAGLRGLTERWVPASRDGAVERHAT